MRVTRACAAYEWHLQHGVLIWAEMRQEIVNSIKRISGWKDDAMHMVPCDYDEQKSVSRLMPYLSYT